ncbi:MAG TPA: inositol monophosphatase, partial [Streptosporangiaceae bacterium]
APLVGWAMLARGDIDGIVGYRAGPLDLHPGVLLATEAGVQVVDFCGDPFEDRHRRGEPRDFLAARPDKIPRLLELMKRADELRKAAPSIL